MTTPDYVLFDPYALLETCPEVDLHSVLASQLYIVDRSLYYELIPMHSTMMVALVTREVCHLSLLAPY